MIKGVPSAKCQVPNPMFWQMKEFRNILFSSSTITGRPKPSPLFTFRVFLLILHLSLSLSLSNFHSSKLFIWFHFKILLFQLFILFSVCFNPSCTNFVSPSFLSLSLSHLFTHSSPSPTLSLTFLSPSFTHSSLSLSLSLWVTHRNIDWAVSFFCRFCEWRRFLRYESWQFTSISFPLLYVSPTLFPRHYYYYP